MTSRKLQVRPAGGGYEVVDLKDGSVVDWIAAPVATGEEPGPADSYVRITERPEAWAQDMRWIVTEGQRVRQDDGLNAGRTGTIVGQGRSQRANREYAENLRKAQEAGRALGDSDFEPLVCAEGPLILWDGETEPDWYPGESAAWLVPVT